MIGNDETISDPFELGYIPAFKGIISIEVIIDRIEEFDKTALYLQKEKQDKRVLSVSVLQQQTEVRLTIYLNFIILFNEFIEFLNFWTLKKISNEYFLLKICNFLIIYVVEITVWNWACTIKQR